jgi:hypothetical protein
VKIRSSIAIWIALLALPVAAHAALGDTVSSVTADQTKMKASLASTLKASYTDNVITNSDGLVVHEYSRADGTVFAVAWNGPYKPDLQQLLGTYFSSYIDAAQQNQQKRGRSLSQLHSTQSGLVIHEAGKMRLFSGVVYVPSLVPSGVDADQLQ